MKIFSVFINDSNKNKEFVEEKFSLAAFCFQILWLLYHRLWFHSAFFAMLSALVYYLTQANFLATKVSFVLNFIISLTIGLFAKSWYINKLKKCNYQLHAVVSGVNEEQARLRFYQEEREVI